jgi:asparagine synthase (glutamine-hydrolysing)
MCGITGIVSPGPKDSIIGMTDLLEYRGPDGRGYYRDPDIAIGQRRLSIIDLERGRQPISNETETMQLVCNGEIYNSPELRSELIARGHRFKTCTDVEVILHLYEEHGRECVRHLRGMFAFAIWDAPRKTLLLARDHLGQKPLFYFHHGDCLVFASEVKAILASGYVPPQLDVDGLWHYMSLRFMPDQYTLFREIHKLPAATSLTFEGGKLAVERYWTLDFLSKFPNDENDIEMHLHALLAETLKLHLLSDVRVGAFLSGGIDSTTIAAMMATMSEKPIPSFSIGVQEQGFNELPFARMVAEKHGLEAHERMVRADLVHLVPTMIYHLDEPADPYGVGVYLVSQLASESVKVVLSGDGADEVFAGYDRYAGQKFVDLYCWLPQWFRHHIMQALLNRLPESYAYKSLAQKAAWLHEMSLHVDGRRYAQSMSFLRFTSEAKDQLFTREARSQIADPGSIDKILAHFDATNAKELVDKMLYTDLMTRVPDQLMVISDRMSMAHSLEVRAPYLDYQVVEFAARIPGSMKLKNGRLKYLLRKVGNRYLPRKLVRRKKQGFGFPLGIWMRSELRYFLERLFSQSRMVEQGIFDGNYVRKLLREHVDGKADHNYRLWLLLNLEIWHRLYIESESVETLRGFMEELSYSNNSAT